THLLFDEARAVVALVGREGECGDEQRADQRQYAGNFLSLDHHTPRHRNRHKCSGDSDGGEAKISTVFVVEKNCRERATGTRSNYNGITTCSSVSLRHRPHSCRASAVVV